MCNSIDTHWYKRESTSANVIPRHLGQLLCGLGEVTLSPESTEWEMMGCIRSLPVLNINSLTLTLV